MFDWLNLFACLFLFNRINNFIYKTKQNLFCLFFLKQHYFQAQLFTFLMINNILIKFVNNTSTTLLKHIVLT